MPSRRDAENKRWTVRRVWWPFGTWLLDLPDWGGLFALGLLLMAPLVVIWPFWVLAKYIGTPWTLIVRREGEEMNREQVVGWAASRERMDAILRHVCSEGGPELPPGTTLD